MTNLETREDVQAFWANVIYIFVRNAAKCLEYLTARASGWDRQYDI
jgi:hypothetical protein